MPTGFERDGCRSCHGLVLTVAVEGIARGSLPIVCNQSGPAEQPGRMFLRAA